MTDELKQQLLRAGYSGVEGWVTFYLSELIAACESPFSDLFLGRYSEPQLWEARGFDQNDNLIILEGSTPEEAVAKLWLALKNSPSQERNTV